MLPKQCTLTGKETSERYCKGCKHADEIYLHGIFMKIAGCKIEYLKLEYKDIIELFLGGNNGQKET